MPRLLRRIVAALLLPTALAVAAAPTVARAQRADPNRDLPLPDSDGRGGERCDERFTRLVNVLRHGAAGDRRTDDSAALERALAVALKKRLPLLLPAGGYKLSRTLHLDYAAVARQGFQLISQNAILDGTAIADAPVLQVDCSTEACFYFHTSGPLTVLARSTAYAVVVGKPDFSDAHNSLKIASLIVNNNGPGGGTQFNYVLASDVYITSVSRGKAGLALNQTVFSKISGALSGGEAGLSLENAYNYANTFLSLDLEESPLCLRISSPRAHNNTFVSLLLNCPTGVAASAGHSNLMLNAMFGGAVKTRTAGVTGLTFLPGDGR